MKSMSIFAILIFTQLIHHQHCSSQRGEERTLREKLWAHLQRKLTQSGEWDIRLGVQDEEAIVHIDTSIIKLGPLNEKSKILPMLLEFHIRWTDEWIRRLGFESPLKYGNRDKKTGKLRFISYNSTLLVTKKGFPSDQTNNFINSYWQPNIWSIEAEKFIPLHKDVIKAGNTINWFWS